MLFFFAFNLLALVSASNPKYPRFNGLFRSHCAAFNYLEIPAIVANCTDITLHNITMPANVSLDLTKLLPHTTVTFAGKTSFGFTNSSSFDPISVSGEHITLRGAPGNVIDGNGQAYWDGLGSNGGVPKPDHFITMNRVTNNSLVEDLHIVNWPTHGFVIENSADLKIRNIFLDNRAGDAPNNRSNGLPAAHNTDGFDVSTCTNCEIASSTVFNQDDCVAVTSGNNILVTGMFCSGSHGLSIGSVGGKSNNNVTNVHFKNSHITSSQNGARIKTNFNTTGFISNITYTNLTLTNISIYGIDIQQDYLNGGPTGIPSSGVLISNILFDDIHGDMADISSSGGNGTSGGFASLGIDGGGDSLDYFVLCGVGSCSDVVFRDVDIKGAALKGSCNFPAQGCPGGVGVNGTVVGKGGIGPRANGGKVRRGVDAVPERHSFGRLV